MKTIRVVAAIIIDNNKVLATERGYGDLINKWECPGGKIEENETPEEALKREIKEEMNVEIKVGELLTTVEYDYPTFHLSMDCFVCHLVKEKFQLLEHKAAKWLDRSELNTMDWCPADVEVVNAIKKTALIG